MDAYVLVGQEAAAAECLEAARRWLGPERRWKIRCTFFTEAASFALVQHNVALSLDLIGQLESLAQGREHAIPMPGPYWKLKIFRHTHFGRCEEASQMAAAAGELLKERCPLYYLDVLAAKAWLERRTTGQLSVETGRELSVFDSAGLPGRRALFAAQGFLP
jgi:hypothetical protein